MNIALKYEPKALAEYKTHHQPLVDVIHMYVQRKTDMPLLMFGPAGTGKTLLAELLPTALCTDYDPANALKVVNAGLDTGIGTIRSVKSFCETWKLSDDNFTAVIIDECDRLSNDAMDALKHLLPAYQDKPSMRVQFILTTNHINRIPAPVQDRCHRVLVPQPTPEQLLDCAMTILGKEGGQFKREDVLDVLRVHISRDGTLSYREFYKRLERLLSYGSGGPDRAADRPDVVLHDNHSDKEGMK